MKTQFKLASVAVAVTGLVLSTCLVSLASVDDPLQIAGYPTYVLTHKLDAAEDRAAVPTDFWKDPDKIDAILRQAAVAYAQAHPAVVSEAGSHLEAVSNGTFVPVDFWKDPGKIDGILRQAAVAYAQAQTAMANLSGGEQVVWDIA